MEEKNMLKQARDYEKEHAHDVPDGQKPRFHFSVPIGWSNDPNGFSYYNGKYHMFYQYNPYDRNFGRMHWGHCTTTDFIRWEYLPAALAPDQKYDQIGCFSGSAIELDGEHVLMYTGVDYATEDPEIAKKLANPDVLGEKSVIELIMTGRVELRQTQCIAVGDGKEYVKKEYNPVITGEMLPEGASLVDFRDPKIWMEDGICYAVIGSMDEQGDGQILLYSSSDLQKWIYEGILYQNHLEYGKMWECPDFFELDEKAVLIGSPIGLMGDNRTFSNGTGSVCVIGDYDRRTHRLKKEHIQMVDYGTDYYAPQSLETPDGRRIQIGWMECIQNNISPEAYRWNGMMTIPRELHIKEGKLYQLPVRELEHYYANPVEHKNVELDGELELEGIKGRYLDMEIAVERGAYEEFTVEVAKGEHCKVCISYAPRENLLTLNRREAGMEHGGMAEKSAYMKAQDGEIRLRILIDNCTLEVFANDGEQAMSMLIFTPEEADGIRFTSKGKLMFHVSKHELCIKNGK